MEDYKVTQPNHYDDLWFEGYQYWIDSCIDPFLNLIFYTYEEVTI